MDGTAADMSDDLYSEINSRDTEQLLKARVSSKTRGAATSAGESVCLLVCCHARMQVL